MHLEAVFEHVGRYTWRPWSIKIAEVLGGSRSGGRRDGSWDSIHWLTGNCGNVESWVQHPPRDKTLARYGRKSILGWWKYSVYAVLGVNSWPWHGVIERDDLTSCSYVMEELSTTKRQMRGEGGNHYEKLGLKWISCWSQFTIPDTAGTSPNWGGNNTDMRSSEPNLARCTPDFAYPLVSSLLFSSSIHITLFLVHHSTMIAEQKVQSSLSISRCHDHELTLSTAFISKMQFSHWEPPGVSERMWSVNLDALISGECQTVGGHFQPAFRVTGISNDWYRSTMGVIVIWLRTPGSASDKPGSTSNHCKAVWEKRHLWEHCRCPWIS